jgi:hypothetical protein
MLPPIRVALRAIKDFAFPLQYQNKLFWRFLKISDNEALELIKEKNDRKKEQENTITLPKTPTTNSNDERNELLEKIKSLLISQQQETLTKKPENNPHLEQKPVVENQSKNLIERGISTAIDTSIKPPRGFEIKRETEFFENTQKEKEIKLPEDKKKKTEKPKEKSEFNERVIKYFEENNIQLINEITAKKKEYFSIVEIKTQLGTINLLCIAKEKKSINESDIAIAIQKSNEEKMPVLLLYPAEMNKKTEEKMKDVKNIVFFKKLE